MAKYPDEEYQSNVRLRSTEWGWRRVRITTPPGQGSQRGAAAPPSRKRRRREVDPRLQIVITYRGGPECSYLVRVDGWTWRYTGVTALHDVMRHIAAHRP